MSQNCLTLCENLRYEVATDRSMEELYYEDVLMLSYDISLPKLRTQGAPIAYIPINQWYSNLAAQLRNHARLELYPMAIEDYQRRQEENFPFNPYDLTAVHQVTYTSSRLFSTFEDVSEYTGGAHPNTTRGGQTWDLCKGTKLKLSDLFIQNCNWREIIMSSIRRQARELANQGVLFEDYEPMLLQYFDPENFYLNDQGVVIFYPLYTIAPYVSGIITFVISYNRLCSCLRHDLFCKSKPPRQNLLPIPPQFTLGRL